MIAFIVNYNRLTYPSRMADWLAGFQKIKPVIIDNNSDYPPLLEYYEETPHEVVRLDKNLGSVAVWHPYAGILDEYDLDGNYIVTDPDLDTSGVPNDWLSVLQEGLRKYDFATKAGFSLRLDDLPNTPVGNKARELEASHWAFPTADGRFYRAAIDTTFCLCRTRIHDFTAVRAAPPYCARHMPWYYTGESSVPADELHYLRSAKAHGSTYWAEHIKKALGI